MVFTKQVYVVGKFFNTQKQLDVGPFSTIADKKSNGNSKSG